MSDPSQHQVTDSTPTTLWRGRTLTEIASNGLDLQYVFKPAGPLTDLEEILVHGALTVDSSLQPEILRPQFTEAINEARIRHSDFDSHVEGILLAQLAWYPCVSRLTAKEIIETYYCIAKHADYLKPARDRALLNNLKLSKVTQ